MNFSVTQNTYRPTPVRGAIVLRDQITDGCSLLQGKFSNLCFEMKCPRHLMLCQTGLIMIPSDRAIIQIPIDRRLL